MLQTGLRYGKFLVDSGRVTEGQERLERTLAAAIAGHGGDDRAYTAWALEYSALAWMRRGLLDQALERANRSFDIYSRHGLDDLTAKLAELRCDLLLLRGDIEEARKALQLSRAARGKTGTADQPGFLQGLLLREAELALAAGQSSRAESLYRQVAAARMPAVLRFQRYRLDAGVGVAKAGLAAGNLLASVDAATAVIDELKASVAPILSSDRLAEALMVRGEGYAGSGDCRRARADWDQAAGLLRVFEDPAGDRFRALARVRKSCTA